MGPIWDQQGPGRPHVGPMNLAIWAVNALSPGKIAQIISVFRNKTH